MSNCVFRFRHSLNCIYLLSSYGREIGDRKRRNNSPNPREHWFFRGFVYIGFFRGLDIGDERREEPEEGEEVFPVAQRREELEDEKGEETFAQTTVPTAPTAFSSRDWDVCLLYMFITTTKYFAIPVQTVCCMC